MKPKILVFVFFKLIYMFFQFTNRLEHFKATITQLMVVNEPYLPLVMWLVYIGLPSESLVREISEK